MRISLFAILGCLALLPANSARGQFPQRKYTPSPTISPYLNLNRGGNSPAFNYYTLVRPEFQFRNQLQQVSHG